jgi:hypothetical protein
MMQEYHMYISTSDCAGYSLRFGFKQYLIEYQEEEKKKIRIFGLLTTIYIKKFIHLHSILFSSMKESRFCGGRPSPSLPHR